MNKIKKPLLFTLAMMPIAIIATIFTVLYQLDMYDEIIKQQLVAQLGSMEIVIVISVIQTTVYTLIFSFVGYLLADKLGLIKLIKINKKVLLITLGWAVIAGVVLSLDYWTFGSIEPLIRESHKAGMTLNGVISAILYGGIVEEIMLRLFMMSLVALIIWKLFFKKHQEVPVKVLIIANVVAAILFAAGHLPATLITFGELSPMILFRCFLLNGGFGLVFGWLYRKHGIQYAMLCHMGAHIISKLIWAIFI